MLAQGQLSYANEERIKKSTQCVCYYCLNTFPAKDVHKFVNDKEGKTALCPICGIDSVIPDEGKPLPNAETISRWHKESFLDEIE